MILLFVLFYMPTKYLFKGITHRTLKFDPFSIHHYADGGFGDIV